jgi:hypothetical protein
MGKLPDAFTGDRTKAEDFIEEVKGYLRLNVDVSGFNSPMKKNRFYPHTHEGTRCSRMD